MVLKFTYRYRPCKNASVPSNLLLWACTLTVRKGFVHPKSNGNGLICLNNYKDPWLPYRWCRDWLTAKSHNSSKWKPSPCSSENAFNITCILRVGFRDRSPTPSPSHYFQWIAYQFLQIFQMKEISTSYRAIASPTLSKTKFLRDSEIPILNVNYIFLA